MMTAVVNDGIPNDLVVSATVSGDWDAKVVKGEIPLVKTMQDDLEAKKGIALIASIDQAVKVFAEEAVVVADAEGTVLLTK